MKKDETEQVTQKNTKAEEVQPEETDNVESPGLELVEDKENEEVEAEEENSITWGKVIFWVFGALAIGFLIGSILVRLGY